MKAQYFVIEQSSLEVDRLVGPALGMGSMKVLVGTKNEAITFIEPIPPTITFIEPIPLPTTHYPLHTTHYPLHTTHYTLPRPLPSLNAAANQNAATNPPTITFIEPIILNGGHTITQVPIRMQDVLIEVQSDYLQ